VGNPRSESTYKGEIVADRHCEQLSEAGELFLGSGVEGAGSGEEPLFIKSTVNASEGSTTSHGLIVCSVVLGPRRMNSPMRKEKHFYAGHQQSPEGPARQSICRDLVSARLATSMGTVQWLS
jgi:hypothetical protein